MKKCLRVLLLATAASLPLIASAESWVVIDSNTPRYAVGTELAGDTELTLAANERLELVGQSGVLITLAGPLQSRPGTATPSGPMAGLVGKGLRIGATRDGMASSVLLPAQRIADDQWQIDMGLVDGILPGSVFALVGENDAELGMAKVESCDTGHCRLNALRQYPVDAVVGARLRAVPAELPLRIQCDPASCDRLDALYRARPALSAVWQQASAAADVAMWSAAGAYWFASPGDDDRRVSEARHLSLADEVTDEELAAALTSTSQAAWLKQLADSAGSGVPDALMHVVAHTMNGMHPLDANQAPVELRTGDAISVVLKAPEQAIRYWVYHIDAHFRVNNFFPEMLGEVADVAAGESREFEVDLDGSDSSGLEQLIVIAIKDGQPRETFVSALVYVLIE